MVSAAHFSNLTAICSHCSIDSTISIFPTRKFTNLLSTGILVKMFIMINLINEFNIFTTQRWENNKNIGIICKN